MTEETSKAIAREREGCVQVAAAALQEANGLDPMGNLTGERILGRQEAAQWIYDRLASRGIGTNTTREDETTAMANAAYDRATARYSKP